jgi:zinc transport system permease protein
LAIALLMISFMPEVRVDLLSYLFGDILAINLNDLLIIVAMGGVVVVWLVFNWHKLLLITISEDLASIDQINVKVVNLQFMLIVSTLVAIAIKIVGVLLITAMLIIPAVVARGISKTPERMAMIASLVSVASVIMGLFSSLQFDTPSGPSIVASSILLFGVSHVLVKNLKKWLN